MLNDKESWTDQPVLYEDYTIFPTPNHHGKSVLQIGMYNNFGLDYQLREQMVVSWPMSHQNKSDR